jgi:hypothetical protein
MAAITKYIYKKNKYYHRSVAIVTHHDQLGSNIYYRTQFVTQYGIMRTPIQF